MKPVVKKYLMAREKARESVRFVIVFISFFVGWNGFARDFFNRRKKSNRKQKDNRFWVTTSRQMDSRGQARSLEEPLDLRTKALGQANYRQLKRIVTVLLLLVINPHYKVWTSMGELEFANAA